MINLKNKKILLLNILLLLGLFYLSFSYNVKASNDENSLDDIYITIDSNDEESSYGVETLAVINEENVEVIITNGVVTKGSTIVLKATPNTGYRFVYWLYQYGDYLKKLSNDSVVNVTVKQNYLFTAVYAKTDQVVVTYLDNTEKNIVDYKVLDNGSSAPNIKAPSLRGYSQKGWDKNLDNIKTDIDLVPIYKATVFSVFRDYAKDFFSGLGLTLSFSVIAVFFALFLGAILCLAKISNIKALKFISSAYIEIIRGVPLLLQLLLIYALMPRIDYGKYLNSEILAAILALFLNSGAYVAEIFRSGIQAVDSGQMEAGRALGLSKWQTMKAIIIPQAIRNVLPSIGNELIMVIKETSLASTIDAGIGELMSIKKQITSATFINIPPFIVIAIMYFVVTFSLSKVVRYIERRLEARD